MNTVQVFLRDNWQRLGLDHTGIPQRLSSLVLTPRFKASRHVVFILMPEHCERPVLVAKVPRLPMESESLENEACVLRSVQRLQAGGFDSVPKVIAFERYGGFPILVETAIVGTPMNPSVVRSTLPRCCSVASDWLVDMHWASRHVADPGWFDRLAAAPLRQFVSGFSLSDDEKRLLERTHSIIEPLRNAVLPLVAEHGDLGHPNLLLQSDGTLGVVDWELARLDGLPACDMFFFLAYAAFASGETSSDDKVLEAFRRAFCGADAWAQTYIKMFAERISLPRPLLGPLFTLCWARYTSKLWLRINARQEQTGHSRLDATAWLRSNRFFALWRYSVDNIDRLRWSPDTPE